jgi:hypothetical protein
MKLNKRVLCTSVGFAWHDTFGSSARWSDYVTCGSSITINCMIQLGQLLEPRNLLWKGNDKLSARGSPWSQWVYVTFQTDLSNKPTAWSRVFLEKLTVSQLIQQFPSLYAFRHVISVLTRVSCNPRVCLWGFCNVWMFLVIGILYIDWSFS